MKQTLTGSIANASGGTADLGKWCSIVFPVALLP
jgi:hypothetical protein